MALQVVHGESRDRGAAEALARHLEGLVDEGSLYVGYPVLATADERVNVDALLVSQQHGLVAFLASAGAPTTAEEFAEYVDEQDRLFTVIEGTLRRHSGLRVGRNLAVTPQTATVFPYPISPTVGDDSGDGFYGTLEELSSFLSGLEPISPEMERQVQAALQRVSTIKPVKKRTGVKAADSRGAVLKKIEKEIANLDRWQKAAAIESPAGPQRIRGLAGSGKTVVLALKAAYWHTLHPDWRIALTFQSRALYGQMEDLVTRFTFEHSNDRPDPEKLRIVHSWGSRGRAGVYSMMAVAAGTTPRNWSYANATYGFDDAFRGVCQELLDLTDGRDVEPIFDAVLIDEAQDLPPEFFQLVYRFTKDVKRVVWGYDELQKLSESSMPSTDELFGKDATGAPLVSLVSAAGAPKRDIVLPVCYRNTPWALVTAHALGIGVYRPDGPVQHPDDPDLWTDIGYEVTSGRLALGAQVTLKRSPTSYPSYFEELLKPEDAVTVNTFRDEDEQDEWVAQQIAINLSTDELEPDDIMIVLPDSYRAKSRGPRLAAALRRQRIKCHQVGVDATVDAIFQPDSVAIAHIYRAKGNEAPMVYAVDCQYGSGQYSARTRRNILFTAITRSRAWVRIVGYGVEAEAISAEIAAVRANDYQLKFQIPSPDDLQTMRRVYRDRNPDDEATLRKATEGLEELLELLDRGDLDIADLPPRIRTRLVSRLSQDDADEG